jgi:hypothetical protein
MRLIVLLIFISQAIVCNAQAVFENFRSFDVIKNDSISLFDFSDKMGVAVIFTSNSCAFDSFYTLRIKAIVDAYSDKIKFLLVNANQEPEESIERMREAYPKRNTSAPYLADKDQLILSLFQAKKTPEVFLLKSSSGRFTLFYSGSIDDNPQVATDVKQTHLKANIERLLQGQPSTQNERPVGCTIRRK